MKAKENRRQAIWMITAVMFVLTLLSTAAQAQSQWETNGTNIYYNAGNVGIGTTPYYKLDVNGTINVRGSGDLLKFNNIGTSAGYWHIGSAGTDVFIGQESSSGGSLITGTGAYATIFGNRDYKPIQFFNGTNAVRMTIAGSGNVGIGTTSPTTRLEVFNAAATSSIDFDNKQLRLNQGINTVDKIYSKISMDDGSVRAADFGLRYPSAFSTTGYQVIMSVNDNVTGEPVNVLTLQGNGNVGVGKTSPNYRLDVAGTINSDSTITANNIVAKYQDVAEWVESSEQLAAGTVVVLDSTKSNQVISSSRSYDTRVAGVISAQPGITLGERGDNKVLVATTGRVKIKVDAGKSPIRIGDLLVTSDIAGAAMKSEAVNLGGVQFHRPGTLIGKALEPLAKGTGSILVLLSLQ